MIKIKKEISYPIIAIVAIVAIVAIFNLSSGSNFTTKESTLEEDTLRGEAISIRTTATPPCLMFYSEETCGDNYPECKWCHEYSSCIEEDHWTLEVCGMDLSQRPLSPK